MRITAKCAIRRWRRANTAWRRASVRVTYSLTVNPDAVPNGETMRAWLPFPRALPGQQENVRLIESTPAEHSIAPESALQRTVYLEQRAEAGKPTMFSITYELTVFGQYHAIDAAKVVPRVAHTGTRASTWRSARRTSCSLPRSASSPARSSARKPIRTGSRRSCSPPSIAFPWAGAREYSTISNLSEYTLHAGHGDCGQQTLLLMTLLRLNGIPTRWQSGWVYSDGDYDNMHDWAQLYLAPYGWVPMDVTFGRLQSGDPQIDAFYLGGLDAYRIAFNDDFSQPFVPAKQHFRSDTVDSQRGEVEWRGGNLYFDQWDYKFEAQVLSRFEVVAAQRSITGRQYEHQQAIQSEPAYPALFIIGARNWPMPRAATVHSSVISMPRTKAR